MAAFAGLAPALPLRPRRVVAATRRPAVPAVRRQWMAAAAGGPYGTPSTSLSDATPVVPLGATPAVPLDATPAVPLAVPVVPVVAPGPAEPFPTPVMEPLGTPVAADKRVVVVGAGWAGLGAAHALVKAGHDVTLVDAADSVGGLVAGWRTAKGNKPVEVGVCLMIPGLEANSGLVGGAVGGCCVLAVACRRAACTFFFVSSKRATDWMLFSCTGNPSLTRLHCLSACRPLFFGRVDQTDPRILASIREHLLPRQGAWHHRRVHAMDQVGAVVTSGS